MSQQSIARSPVAGSHRLALLLFTLVPTRVVTRPNARVKASSPDQESGLPYRNELDFFPLSIRAKFEFGLKIEKVELCILYELEPKAL
jgi:hypothetical protein